MAACLCEKKFPTREQVAMRLGNYDSAAKVLWQKISGVEACIGKTLISYPKNRYSVVSLAE